MEQLDCHLTDFREIWTAFREILTDFHEIWMDFMKFDTECF